MEQARMVIELEIGTTPIGGALYDSRGVPHAFIGWMELASVLHAAIESACDSRERLWQTSSDRAGGGLHR
jgi:hypothetical protein